MKIDDAAQVMSHKDDVDDDQDETGCVEDIIHFVRNYIRDGNFLVLQYLIKENKEYYLIYSINFYVLLSDHNHVLVRMHMVQDLLLTLWQKHV